MKSKKAETPNQIRNRMYAQMASDAGDKESRNRSLETTISQNLTVMEDNFDLQTQLYREKKLLEKRQSRALAKAKTPEEKSEIAKVFGPLLAQAKYAPKMVALLPGQSILNRMEKKGATRATQLVLHPHAGGNCGNPACAKCFPSSAPKKNPLVGRKADRGQPRL